MEEDIEDTNVREVVELRTPRQRKDAMPLGDVAAATVRRARRELRDILHGRDRERLVVLVGPCSIHDPEAARDYAARLAPVAGRNREKLLVIMRTFFEKPRTTIGWKGLVNDPDLDGSCDIERGLELARRLLVDLNALGVACGTEFLDPVVPQYLGDAISWAAIGARTTESQTHREMASGLSMPVGFKNGTDGSLEIALHAMISAGHPHSFLGIDGAGRTSLVRTKGNPDRHVVLRGGKGGTNHGAAEIAMAAEMVAGEGVARSVMVDCSHGNSAKDFRRQSGVAREVLQTFAAGEPRIMGMMLESNIGEGRQDWDRERLAYGVSITDACIGWEETEALLDELAARPVAARACA
jgi:3-deoxy-7-phosphoheptulonate synthase